MTEPSLCRHGLISCNLPRPRRNRPAQKGSSWSALGRAEVLGGGLGAFVPWVTVELASWFSPTSVSAAGHCAERVWRGRCAGEQFDELLNDCA